MGKIRSNPPHSCNILHLGESARQLWQFSLAGGNATLTAEDRSPATVSLPPSLVTKTWKSIWQRKVNVAWLAAEQVFLRVVQLPACAPEELPSIVELQLEKLSPIPLNQAVWSFEVVSALTASASPTEPANSPEGTPPTEAPGMQILVVIIANRNQVEGFLGNLEGQGYLADRLEFPALHQLLTAPVESDGVWILPSLQEGKNAALIAWWAKRNLQHITILNLPSDERWIPCLQDHLNQAAWAAEMEGWLQGPPACHLVADATTAAVWEPVLNGWAPSPVTLLPALARPELAALSARRLARNESRTNLMPQEFAARYRQQFTDRLWLRGLGALLVAYLGAVLVYFGALEVLKYQLGRLQKQVRDATPDYQKAQQAKARGEVLQNQINLKYAALDCWKIASELLPADITLNSFSFQRGKLLMLAGIVPTDQVTNVSLFHQALVGATIDNKRLFNKVNLPVTTAAPGGPNYSWNFTCELDTAE